MRPALPDQLNAKHTVVLNLESASKEVSRRLIDFLSGVAYANNGQSSAWRPAPSLLRRTTLILWVTCSTSWKTMASSSDTANAVRGFVPPQNDDERRLMRRVEELCRVAVSRGIPRYTGFLSDREQSLAQPPATRPGAVASAFGAALTRQNAGCSVLSRPTPGRKNRWPTCNAPLTGISCRPTGIISVRFWALALSAAAWGPAGRPRA